MVIFVENSGIKAEEYRKLQEYLDQKGLGIVILVDSVNQIKVEGE